MGVGSLVPVQSLGVDPVQGMSSFDVQKLMQSHGCVFYACSVLGRTPTYKNKAYHQDGSSLRQYE